VMRSSLANRRSISGRRVCAAIAETESRPTVHDLTASVCSVVPVYTYVAWRRDTQVVPGVGAPTNAAGNLASRRVGVK